MPPMGTYCIVCRHRNLLGESGSNCIKCDAPTLAVGLDTKLTDQLDKREEKRMVH